MEDDSRLVCEAASHIGGLCVRPRKFPKLLVTHAKRDREPIKGAECKYPGRKVRAELRRKLRQQVDWPCARIVAAALNRAGSPYVAAS
jgi:hypothetical protein